MQTATTEQHALARSASACAPDPTRVRPLSVEGATSRTITCMAQFDDPRGDAAGTTKAWGPAPAPVRLRRASVTSSTSPRIKFSEPAPGGLGDHPEANARARLPIGDGRRKVRDRSITRSATSKIGAATQASEAPLLHVGEDVRRDAHQDRGLLRRRRAADAATTRRGPARAASSICSTIYPMGRTLGTSRSSLAHGARVQRHRRHAHALRVRSDEALARDERARPDALQARCMCRDLAPCCYLSAGSQHHLAGRE